MTWHVRPATVADLPAILQLERQTAELPHWSKNAYQRYLAPAGNSALYRLIVVDAASGGSDELPSGLFGFAAAVSLAPATGIVDLESIAVDPQMRRSGIARTLCLDVLTWARTNGMHGVELEVRAQSVAALTLYRQIGFSEVGRRPRYYAAPVEDAVLMSIVL